MTIVEIKETDLYDDAVDSKDAVDIMQNTYANNTNWHTSGINLHIALLGKDLGGGIAYRGGVCKPNAGFAVSSGIIGTGTNVGQGMYWDIFVTAHELG